MIRRSFGETEEGFASGLAVGRWATLEVVDSGQQDPDGETEG